MQAALTGLLTSLAQQASCEVSSLATVKVLLLHINVQQSGRAIVRRCRTSDPIHVSISHPTAVAQMQQRILKVFKSGELNVLVATAVAEEGLDIVHCSLVVRFNLAPTARQFIQSRGRARAQGSAMALMLEHGAEAHQKLVGDALKSAPAPHLHPPEAWSMHASRAMPALLVQRRR